MLKHSIVRVRCIQFIDILQEYGKEELPLDDAIFLFRREIGEMDNKTIVAYFGQPKQRIETIFDTTKRYQNGTVSMGQIKLARRLNPKAGYFEILDLAEIKTIPHVNPDKVQHIFIVKPTGIIPELKIDFSPPHPHSSLENRTDECTIEGDYVMDSTEKHGHNLYLSPFRDQQTEASIPFSSKNDVEEGVEGGENNNKIENNSNNNNLKAERYKSVHTFTATLEEKNPELEINPLTDKPPLEIKDHDADQILGFYEKEANNELKKEDYVSKPKVESFWKDDNSPLAHAKNHGEERLAKLDEAITKTDDPITKVIWQEEREKLEEKLANSPPIKYEQNNKNTYKAVNICSENIKGRSSE